MPLRVEVTRNGADRRVVETGPGKVGESVSVQRANLSYSSAGNLRPERGTIELWLHAREPVAGGHQ